MITINQNWNFIKEIQTKLIVISLRREKTVDQVEDKNRRRRKPGPSTKDLLNNSCETFAEYFKYVENGTTVRESRSWQDF